MVQFLHAAGPYVLRIYNCLHNVSARNGEKGGNTDNRFGKRQ